MTISYREGTVAGDAYTVAGSPWGTAGSSGDGGAAASALLSGPIGVAVDSADDIYIADAGNDRVQEVAGTTRTQWGQTMGPGDIYTVAGTTGSSGDGGDGGRANAALLNGPCFAGVDSLGDLYIADAGNNVVREVLSYANILAPGGPTQPKESAGGTNPSEPYDPQPTFGSGDVRGNGVSVNAATGELDVNVQDFSVPGRGEPLVLSRTCSSTVATQAGAVRLGLGGLLCHGNPPSLGLSVRPVIWPRFAGPYIPKPGPPRPSPRAWPGWNGLVRRPCRTDLRT